MFVLLCLSVCFRNVGCWHVPVLGPVAFAQGSKKKKEYDSLCPFLTKLNWIVAPTAYISRPGFGPQLGRVHVQALLPIDQASGLVDIRREERRLEKDSRLVSVLTNFHILIQPILPYNLSELQLHILIYPLLIPCHLSAKRTSSPRCIVSARSVKLSALVRFQKCRRLSLLNNLL